MQKAVLEGPMLGQIHPAVVLIFPAVVAHAADDQRGEGLGLQGGYPEPLVSCGFRLEAALAVMILGEGLFGSDHPDGLGVILRERQSRRVPELDLVSLAVRCSVQELSAGQ